PKTRHILAALAEMGDQGFLVQRKLLTDLCRLRKVPDPNCPDPQKALDALRRLKELAVDHGELVEAERHTARERASDARLGEQALQDRAMQTVHLREIFYELAKGTDHRGYSLERLIGYLFTLNEIPYRPSYRTAVEQVDGHFNF